MSDARELTPHEANYNLIAAAIATAAATMLTLLTTLGTADIISKSGLLKGLLEAELLVIEFSLIVSVVALLRRGQSEKRRLVLGSAFLLIFGHAPALAQRYDAHLRLIVVSTTPSTSLTTDPTTPACSGQSSGRSLSLTVSIGHRSLSPIITDTR